MIRKKVEFVTTIKEHVPLISWDDISTLDNCLVTEIHSQNEKCFVTCTYRSLSQNQDEFKNFCTNFDILLKNSDIWDYEKVNIENIKKVISNFDWNKTFENLSVDEKEDFLNKTLLNIFRNYIWNKKN